MIATGIAMLGVACLLLFFDEPLSFMGRVISMEPRHYVYALTLVAGVILTLAGVVVWAWRALP
jgi:preprotein translocase subunit Sec61beta